MFNNMLLKHIVLLLPSVNIVKYILLWIMS